MRIANRKTIILVSLVVICLLLAFITDRIQRAPTGLEYQVLFIEDVPAYVYKHYEKQQTSVGFSTILYDNKNYVLVTPAIAKTDGYSVEVDKVRKENNRWIIKLHLNPPARGSKVTQAITYPAIAIRLPKDDCSIHVLNAGKALGRIR